MKPRKRCYSYWKKCLVGAGVLMFVLWDSTPAQNYIYSYLDSNGTRHIKNISLEAPPVQGRARRHGLRPRQTDVLPRRASLLKAYPRSCRPELIDYRTKKASCTLPVCDHLLNSSLRRLGRCRPAGRPRSRESHSRRGLPNTPKRAGAGRMASDDPARIRGPGPTILRGQAGPNCRQPTSPPPTGRKNFAV